MRKFENGLRGDLKLMITPLFIKEFHALVGEVQSDGKVES